jgi:glycosyltransferase involved in cell wall biosynthesis
MRIWSRGVDSDLFRPRPEASIDLPKPIHLCVARIAVEKNLEAFLSLDLPGSKVIVGDGPDRPLLQSRYPDAHFLGARFGEDLATLYSAADVFVFPSKTETFGLVMLEALASGVPVAAFPVSGLIQELAQQGCAATHNDLGLAAREALALSPAKCRDFALSFTHARSTRQFLDNVASVIDQPLTLAA